VRCQRCERPTCPACQREAPVGVQCVDCVAEAARAAPVTRTAFGGRVRGGRPAVTFAVMGACVVLYLLQQAGGGLVLRLLAFFPALAGEQPWRFVTAAFLHSPSNLLHIAFNLYALYLTGPYLEQVLGRLRFAALYLVAAFGGSVGYLLIAGLDAPPTVGASGAVFGLFGALLVVQRRLGRQTGQIVGVLVVNGVLGFALPNVAWEAHLGGLLTGAAVAAVMVGAPAPGVPRDRRGAARRSAVQAVGTLAVAALLVALAVARLALSGA
jgi:membrane associated rhomboid family serine protease